MICTLNPLPASEDHDWVFTSDVGMSCKNCHMAIGIDLIMMVVRDKNCSMPMAVNLITQNIGEASVKFNYSIPFD